MVREQHNENKRHILVIDDEEVIRTLFQRSLFKAGYNVSVAANGLHATQKIRSGARFDLIVCDLKMPGMSGVDFLKELRKLGLNTPLIVLTGFPEKDKVVEALKAGVSAVVLKPVRPSELMEKIEVILGGSEDETEFKQAA